jgi:hypothetical protein
MTISKSQYYFKSANGDKRCVVLYSEGITETWDRDTGSQRKADGDQFESFKQQLVAQGFQPDRNPGWDAPQQP